MLRTLIAGVLAATVLGLPGFAQATPVATSLASGHAFQSYTGAPAVGAGLVDTDATLFWVRERRVGDLESWLIFFDPATRGARLQATIEFDGEIEDILSTRRELLASTPTYGVDIDGDQIFDDYDFRPASGVEGQQDPLAWTARTRTLTIRWRTHDPGDHVRVLVRAAGPQAVPEPASLALALGGLLAAGVVRRRTAPRG